jgi:hypothetical protein
MARFNPTIRAGTDFHTVVVRLPHPTEFHHKAATKRSIRMTVQGLIQHTDHADDAFSTDPHGAPDRAWKSS